MKLVSIIIPAYNVEKYIERCLISINKQTYQNIEVLIINDGSRDNTESVVLEFCKAYENFKYYKKENGGVSSARNLGLDMASGDYISFIDSDDTIEPTFIEKLVNNIKEEDAFCMVNGMYKVINGEKQEYLIKKDAIPFLKNPSCCLRLYHKKDIDELNLRFEKSSMGEDLEFVSKLLIHKNNYSIVEDFLYDYYMNDDSLTHTYTRHVYSVMEAIERIEEFAKNQEKYEEFKVTLEYMNICHVLIALMKNASKVEDFNNNDIDEIIDYVENKYPNWQNNKVIIQLSEQDREYLNNLKLRNYGKINEYLKCF